MIKYKTWSVVTLVAALLACGKLEGGRSTSRSAAGEQRRHQRHDRPRLVLDHDSPSPIGSIRDAARASPRVEAHETIRERTLSMRSSSQCTFAASHVHGTAHSLSG